MNKFIPKFQAVSFVLGWASVNEDNLNEDWYNEYFPEAMGIEWNELTEQDKENARVEFKYLAKLLRKRANYYHDKIKAFNNQTKEEQ